MNRGVVAPDLGATELIMHHAMVYGWQCHRLHVEILSEFRRRFYQAGIEMVMVVFISSASSQLCHYINENEWKMIEIYLENDLSFDF